MSDQGTVIMARKTHAKSGDEAVRIASDVAKMARIGAAIADEHIGVYISDILRPILIERLEQAGAGGLVPPIKPKRTK